MENHRKAHEELNITKYIVAKLTKDGVVLTYNKQAVGNIPWQSISNVQLDTKRFSFKGNNIYSNVDISQPSQYVENCDLGWC